MFSIEVPILAVSPELIDPNYGQRHELTQAAQSRDGAFSAKVIMLGHLADKATFSQLVDFNRIDRGDCKANEDAWDWLIDFDVDPSRGVACYGLPPELNQFREAIALVAAHEHGAYPNAKYEGLQVTIDQTPVKAGTPQRSLGIHRDGLKGEWLHVYTASDNQPTIFLPSDSSPVQAENHQVAFANRTTFHYSPVFRRKGRRTFFRASYLHKL